MNSSSVVLLIVLLCLWGTFVDAEGFKRSWKRRTFQYFYEESPVCRLSPDEKIRLAQAVLKQKFVMVGKFVKKPVVTEEEMNTPLKNTVDLVTDPECKIMKFKVGPVYYQDEAYHFATGRLGEVNEGIKYYLKWDENDGVYVAQTVKNAARLLIIYEVTQLTKIFPSIRKDEIGLRNRIAQKWFKKKDE